MSDHPSTSLVDNAATTPFVRALLAADRGALDSALGDDVVFNSPVRQYTSRVQVLHLLSLIGGILPGAGVERTWSGTGGAATVISAVIDGALLDGVVEELHDTHGQVRAVTLMLRPHAAMMLAIKRMAAALERSVDGSAAVEVVSQRVEAGVPVAGEGGEELLGQLDGRTVQAVPNPTPFAGLGDDQPGIGQQG